MGDSPTTTPRRVVQRLRQPASARPASGTLARAPPRDSDASPASIIRTTSSPSAADDRGALPERTDEQKSVSSSCKGLAAATRGERMSPVRYVSLYSPKVSGFGIATPESNTRTGSFDVSSYTTILR